MTIILPQGSSGVISNTAPFFKEIPLFFFQNKYEAMSRLICRQPLREKDNQLSHGFQIDTSTCDLSSYAV